MSILEGIVGQRRQRIAAQGHEFGAPVPESRRVPLVPFGRDPLLICEIKRRSPSKGWIDVELDAAAKAREYGRRGILHVSVLTEEDHFAGSLRDLMAAKAATPEAAILRKDFLLDELDVEVSYRAGADAVLLIASILSADELAALYRKAKGLGMEVLVEVHDERDVDKAARIRPSVTGINCRDLMSFSTDLMLPVRVARLVDWPTLLVFESGIRSREEALFARSCGFDGILAGEAVVRDGSIVDELLGAFRQKAGDFWRKLYARERPGKPLVKICGIAREEDGRLAAKLGADAIGFIFAESPRRAPQDLPRKLADLGLPKVAVVVGPGDEGTRLAARLLQEGFIDAVQFHGTETPAQCFQAAFPYYKAARVGSPEDVDALPRYRCPRVLLDAFSAKAMGGTGESIPAETVERARAKFPLWLAGGIGPRNVRGIMERFSPELVDLSSGLESAPGVKDPERVKSFFKEIDGDTTQ